MYQVPSYTNTGLTSAQSVVLNTVQHVTTLTPTMPIITNAPIVIKQIESIPDAPISYETSAILVENVLHTILPTATLYNSEISDESSDGAIIYSSVQPFQLVGVGGTGGGGGSVGSTISTFNDLHTSSFSVSTITMNSAYVSLGLGAGSGLSTISIGNNAQNSSPGRAAVSIGVNAGRLNQGADGIAIGRSAGEIDQLSQGIAVGNFAGWSTQGSYAVSIGKSAGYYSTGTYSVNLGHNAGAIWAGENSIAIGNNAGIGHYTIDPITNDVIPVSTGLPDRVIVINATGAEFNASQGQNDSCFITPVRQYIMSNACNLMMYDQVTNEVGQVVVPFLQDIITSSITINSEFIFLGSTISIGYEAGQGQLENSIAIGNQAGYETQAHSAVAIGRNAGRTNQGENSIAISSDAGAVEQGENSIAMGYLAGGLYQSTLCVAIGALAGVNIQGTKSIAIGSQAGYSTMGACSIAIGYQAGRDGQAPSTIILNATGTTVNGVLGQDNSFYVCPVRNVVATGLSTMVYNPDTFEIGYTTALGSSAPGGNAGAVQYNTGTGFGGVDSFSFDDTKSKLQVSQVSVSTLTVNGMDTLLGVQFYTDSYIDTNIYIGNTPPLLPNVQINAFNLGLGSSLNPLASFSIYSVTSVSLTSPLLTFTGGILDIVGGAINLGAGSLNLTAGNIVIDSGAIEMASGNITLTSGAIEVTAGNILVVAGALEVVAGQVLLGTAGHGAENSGGVLQYGGNYNLHQGITDGAGGYLNADSGVVTSSIMCSMIHTSSMTIGNATDAVETTNTLILYGDKEHSSGIWLSSVNGANRSPGLFTNFIASEDATADSLFIDNVYAVQNASEQLQLIGLSTINGVPFFPVSNTFKEIFTSSMYASSIVVGDPADSGAYSLGSRIILYGGNNSGGAGIYLSSISESGIGAGLYTNVIEPADRTGTTKLNITGVQNIENSNYQMRLVGVSTVNGVVHNPLQTSYFSSLGATDMNVSSLYVSSLNTYSTNIEYMKVSSLSAYSANISSLFVSSLNVSSLITYSTLANYMTISTLNTDNSKFSTIDTQSFSSIKGSFGDNINFTSFSSDGNLTTTVDASFGANINVNGYVSSMSYTDGFSKLSNGNANISGYLSTSGIVNFASTLYMGNNGVSQANIYLEAGGSINVSGNSGGPVVLHEGVITGDTLSVFNISTARGSISTANIKSLNTDSASISSLSISTLYNVNASISTARISTLLTSIISTSFVNADLVKASISSTNLVNTQISYLNSIFNAPGIPTLSSWSMPDGGLYSLGITIGGYPQTVEQNELNVYGKINVIGAQAITTGDGGIICPQNAVIRMSQSGLPGGSGIEINGGATWSTMTIRNGSVVAPNSVITNSLSISSIATPGHLFISTIAAKAPGNLSTLVYNPSTFEISYTSPSASGISSFNQLYTSSLNVSSIVAEQASISTVITNYLSISSIATPGNLFISTIAAKAPGNLSTLVYNPSTFEISYTSPSVISSFNQLYTSSLNVSSIVANQAFISQVGSIFGNISSLGFSTMNGGNASISTVTTYQVAYPTQNILVGTSNATPTSGNTGIISIGNNASAQTTGQISIGSGAGSNLAGTGYSGAISIGENAGQGINGLGVHSIYIGAHANHGTIVSSSRPSTIMINATAGGIVVPHSGCFIKPINNNSVAGSSNLMFYDTNYGELSYALPVLPSLGVSSFTASTITTGGSVTFGTIDFVSTSVINSVSSFAKSGSISTANIYSLFNNDISISSSVISSIVTNNISSVNIDCGNFSTLYGSISSLSVSSINNGSVNFATPSFYFAGSNTTVAPSSSQAITTSYTTVLSKTLNIPVGNYGFNVNATATCWMNGTSSNVYAGIFVDSAFVGVSTIITDTTVGTPNQLGFGLISVNYADSFTGSGEHIVDLQLHTDDTGSGNYTFVNGAMNIITGLTTGV